MTDWKWIEKVFNPDDDDLDAITPAAWLNELQEKHYMVDSSLRITSPCPGCLYAVVRIGPKGVEDMTNAVIYEIQQELLGVEA